MKEEKKKEKPETCPHGWGETFVYLCEECNMKEEKQKTGECGHLFSLSRIDNEQTNEGSGGTGYFYQRVAYIVCEKCGEVRKQLV